MPSVTTLRLPIALMCSILVVIFAFNTPQYLVHAEDNIVGRWYMSMTAPPGAGLDVQFDIRPDGTYNFSHVFTNNRQCASRLSYEGKYRISGRTIEFTPSSGKRGCVTEKALGAKELADKKAYGNRRNNFRFREGQLCLADESADESEESCFSRK
jgi:hypothetical protein